MTLEGIDVSNNNGTVAWDRVAGAGIVFALSKATEGITFRDAFLQQNFAACKALGLGRGAYHFARPSRNGAASEAAFFVSVVRDLLEPGDLVALDFEDEDLPVGAQGGAWALAWLGAVEAALGFRPLLYTYPSYVPERNVTAPGLARYPLWWASYDLTAYPPPAPWGGYAIWQYTADGKVPGVAGQCDRDRFAGTLDQLRALGKGGGAPPFQHAEGWLDPLVDRFDWTQDGTEGAGIITYRKVRVYNDEKGLTEEREWDAVTGFTPWVVK
jgi:lysozyme